AEFLATESEACQAIQVAGLIRHYQSNEWLTITAAVRGLPLPLSHDAEPTFGFRFEGAKGLFGSSWAIGYAADLGSWDDELAKALADVELLAVEFNHDVNMQRTSGRPAHLIERVLSDDGHLSNEQGAELIRAAIRYSANGCLRYVLPLHLSRQCNR